MIEKHTELRKLAEAATPGPWFVRHAATDDGLSEVEDGRMHGLFPFNCEAHDAAFIAAANPKTVLELLDEVTKLREAMRTASDALAFDPYNTWKAIEILGTAFKDSQ